MINAERKMIMSKGRKITVTVFGADRLPNSVNGNPRYTLRTDAGLYTTASDHGFVYGIMNGWTADHDANGREARLTLTPTHRVTDLEWVDKGNVHHHSPADASGDGWCTDVH